MSVATKKRKPSNGVKRLHTAGSAETQADILAQSNAFQKLFGSPFGLSGGGGGGATFHRPIEVGLAQGCINKYREVILDGTDLDDLEVIKKSYTESVAHGSYEVGKWLSGELDDYRFNNLRIFIGIYTDEMIEHYNLKPEQYADRMTVIIWPYEDNERAVRYDNNTSMASPFNLGDLKP
jgi:hypothetical protein